MPKVLIDIPDDIAKQLQMLAPAELQGRTTRRRVIWAVRRFLESAPVTLERTPPRRADKGES